MDTGSYMANQMDNLIQSGIDMKDEMDSLQIENEQLKSSRNGLVELATAIMGQTQAINALVESNQRLMMILTEGMIDEEDQPATTYMDGTPICPQNQTHISQHEHSASAMRSQQTTSRRHARISQMQQAMATSGARRASRT